MTGTIARGEAAHLIPQKMKEWFDLRGMAIYDDFDSPSNGILLRPDIHQILDLQYFAFVPRTLLNPSGESKSVIVAYVFRRDCIPEAVEMYHDVETQPISGIRLEFLYYRFVFTVFEALRAFMRQGLPRWLKVNADGNKCQTNYARQQRAKTTPFEAAAVNLVPKSARELNLGMKIKIHKSTGRKELDLIPSQVMLATTLTIRGEEESVGGAFQVTIPLHAL